MRFNEVVAEMRILDLIEVFFKRLNVMYVNFMFFFN